MTIKLSTGTTVDLKCFCCLMDLTREEMEELVRICRSSKEKAAA